MARNLIIIWKRNDSGIISSCGRFEIRKRVVNRPRRVHGRQCLRTVTLFEGYVDGRYVDGTGSIGLTQKAVKRLVAKAGRSA